VGRRDLAAGLVESCRREEALDKEGVVAKPPALRLRVALQEGEPLKGVVRRLILTEMSVVVDTYAKG
jgi:hypothetical protein